MSCYSTLPLVSSIERKYSSMLFHPRFVLVQFLATENAHLLRLEYAEREPFSELFLELLFSCCVESLLKDVGAWMSKRILIALPLLLESDAICYM